MTSVVTNCGLYTSCADRSPAVAEPAQGYYCCWSSAGVVAVHELVEGVVVDASQVLRHVRLRHLVEVVTAQQLVLARTAVLDLARLRPLVTQPVNVNVVQCAISEYSEASS